MTARLYALGWCLLPYAAHGSMCFLLAVLLLELFGVAK